MNSSIIRSIQAIFRAVHEEPELARHPNFEKLFGALKLIGEENSQDMILEALPRSLITLADYQAYGDKIYRLRLCEDLRYKTERLYEAEELPLVGARHYGDEEVFDQRRQSLCLECFRQRFLEGRLEHERPSDVAKNYEPIQIQGYT